MVFFCHAGVSKAFWSHVFSLQWLLWNWLGGQPLVFVSRPLWLLCAGLCGFCVQAFVASFGKPLWLLSASLCGFCVQALVAFVCKPLWLLCASLCGFCVCKPLWLLCASLCGFCVQAFAASFGKPSWLLFASLCGFCVQAFVASVCNLFNILYRMCFH